MSHVRVHERCGCGIARESGGFGGRPFAFAGTPHNFERDRPFAIERLAADVTLDVPKKSIRATASLAVRRVDKSADTIDLDAVGFTIESVDADGKPAEHRYDGRVLSVVLGKSVQNATIRVVYRATPRRGLYFLAPDEHVPNRPRQVWSQCQEEDARHWLPCHDKPHVKMTTELTVTAPEGWKVLGNGELTRGAAKEKQSGSTFTWTMNEPHPSYLITLVAGEFTVLEAEADGVPLTYWIPKGRDDDGKRTFAKTPKMIEHFGKLLGVKYPWNKYAQVVVSDFIFGGMENTTATTLYEYTLIDPRAALDITSDDLIAHELAHQWFGDYVTCRDWSEGWLNEGFATYMEHVWKEKDLGRDEYEFGLLGDLESYTAEAGGRYRRPIVCQDWDAPLDLFDRHLYEKGGLVLHMLRTELGDEAFWGGVRAYLEKHAKGIVETRDLMRALEGASGKSLGRFFEQWVHKPGHPEIDVSVAWDAGVLTCDVKQHQSAHEGVPNAFELPLWLEVVVKGKSERRKLSVTQRTELFAVPCEERPDFVVVDPELRILGEVVVKAPGDMLRNQLKNGKTARARYLAAQALGHVDDPPTIEALAEKLADEKEFWGTRHEVASALAKIRSSDAEAVLRAATKTKHPKVRRSVASALGSFKTAEAFEALKPLALRDESFLVQSDAARSIGKTKQHAALDVLLDVVDRPSWADVVSVGALDGFAASRDDRAVPHVVARTRYGHPTRTRRAAIVALPKIAEPRKARETLEDLLDDKDPYLRVDVVRALADLGDPKARTALRSKLDSDLDPRVRRRIREALRDLGGEGKRAVEQLREELDKLRTEHAELKSRVAKVEAHGTSSGKERKKKRK